MTIVMAQFYTTLECSYAMSNTANLIDFIKCPNTTLKMFPLSYLESFSTKNLQGMFPDKLGHKNPHTHHIKNI